MRVDSLIVRRAAVLGAGVMGARIAAHLANADVPVLLFDLPAPGDDRSGIARAARQALLKAEPPALAAPDRLEAITPVNYDEHLAKLAGCDLVIEAIAERLDLKRTLLARIAPHLAPAAVLATNTSGLSVAALAEALPAELRARFCGIHFFNPPRHMKLVELVATNATDPGLLDAVEPWLTSRLGKGVIRAKDTPNFVANRIGVFALLSAMHHMARLNLGFDEVDALTGPAIGRPKSATFGTADVVGLDTLAQVIRTLAETLPADPWHRHFRVPDWLAALIAKGALGRKAGAGIYRKEGRELRVVDLARADYRPAGATELVAGEVAAILATKSPAERLAALRASQHPQAQFLWAIQRDLFHYCAVQLGEIAGSARDIDLALRWGFGWSLGPFETWQAAGWRETAAAIAADIAAGRTLADVPLPAWVSEREGVHETAGSWSAVSRTLTLPSALPVYRRQLRPERLLGEAPADRGETLREDVGLRLWRLPAVDAGIGIVSFKSKMHTIGDEVLDAILDAVTWAERELDGLVIWHEPPFSAGANLRQVLEACETGRYDSLEATIAKFQRATLALKYAQLPVVAAIQGLGLGGGCELPLHCARRVLALESYLGLVEAGVGLIPAGGGSKELALAAARRAARTAAPAEVFPFIAPMFQAVAQATVTKSALEAKALGYAAAADPVVFNADELLWVALKEARALAEAGWRPPLPQRAFVAGRAGIANCEAMLANLRAGGQISAHDYRVAKAAATALCGGEVDAGSRVDEDWLLAVERREFVALLKTPETQARIRHMLETGKPLRN